MSPHRPGLFRVIDSVKPSVFSHIFLPTVDEIMKIGGWKTERVARYYVGLTTNAVARSKGKLKRNGGSQRARDNSYAIAMDFPLSQAFQDNFAVCKQR